MPTPAPCCRMARRVASTSSLRRCWRCSSQRVLRPSGASVLTGRDGSRYCRYLLPSVLDNRRERTSPKPRSPGGQPLRAAARRRPRRQPHPVRPRQSAPTREASNQDMLTAALEGLVARFGLAGERLGEVVGGAVLKHSRDFNLTREAVLGSSLSAHHPRLRRAAGLRHRPRGGHPRRQQDRPRARSSPASPAAPTRPRDAPDRRATRACAETLLQLNRARTASQRLKAHRGAAPRPRSVSGDPAQRRAAHRAVDGRAHGPAPPSGGASPARPRTSWPLASHRNLAAAYDRGFFDDLVTPYLGLTRDENLRPDSIAGEAGLAQAGLRQGRGRHDDGRQLHAADRRRLRRAARHARSGRPSTGCPCWPTSSTRETAAVDYVTGDEGLLMAPAYAVPRLLAAQRADAAGLRPLRDPRGVRLDGALDPRGLGGRGVLPRPARPRRAARRHRPRPAQRQRLLAGRRAPVRRHRRSHRRLAGQAAAREGLRGPRA